MFFRSGLLLLAFLAFAFKTQAQVFFSMPLGIDNAVVHYSEILAYETILTVGRLNNALHLVNWSNTGVTLWTGSIASSITFISTFLKRATGGILISGISELILIDDLGNVLSQPDVNGSHVLERGYDNLLVVASDPLFLKDRVGTILWQRDLARRNSYHFFAGNKLGTWSGGFSVYSFSSYGISQSNTYSNAVFLGKYTNNGDLLNTNMVMNDTVGPVLKVSDMIDMNHEGALGVGIFKTVSPLMVRTNAQGNIVWQEHIEFDTWPAGLPAVMVPERALELPRDRFALIGICVSANNDASFGIVEFNGSGAPICWQDLGPFSIGNETQWSTLELTNDDYISVFATTHAQGQPLQVNNTVYENICFTTSVTEAKPIACGNVFPSTIYGQRTVDRSQCQNAVGYSVIDATGRTLAQGSDPGTQLQVNVGSATGVAIIRTAHQKTGIIEVDKIVLP